MLTITDIRAPQLPADSDSRHHCEAALFNHQIADQTETAMFDALDGRTGTDCILLKAAAGAGKSYVLKQLVQSAVHHPGTIRVGITAFTNNQIIPLAADLGKALGPQQVCLWVSKDRFPAIPAAVRESCTVVGAAKDVPQDAKVLVATSHMYKWASSHLKKALLGNPKEDDLFDVLFVDEAWQMAHYLYDGVKRLAPLSIGVGDVGQLPPLDGNANPWRGDEQYNPYRAWPTDYEHLDTTVTLSLPSVWRPTAEQLPLWKAFYPQWETLTCVAGPGDRGLEVRDVAPDARAVWEQVGTGQPTLLEISGLPDAEAADIDLPMIRVLERLLEELLTDQGFTLRTTKYDGQGRPTKQSLISLNSPGDDALIAVLATRNQAVDDAKDMVERLQKKLELPEGILVASTVDSWQGQTNALTVAIHPLSGASRLDAFNSAFGRLAVTCTRATHGLLMVARDGVDDLLQNSPAVPGTPFGEPGVRSLPRQTHTRILDTFIRMKTDHRN